MELDKRIKDITDIFSVTDGCNEILMDKKGYFADTIIKFKDLKKCIHGKYAGYDGEKDRCFLVEVEGESSLKQARYFIPEFRLKPEEKKYRPYTLKEFTDKFSLGDEVIMRSKDTHTIKHVLFTEYEEVFIEPEEENSSMDVCIGHYWYTFTMLFVNYEICTDEGWKPFGVEE